MEFEGIFTPVITPRGDGGGVDRAALAAQVEYLVASGVHGIVSGGSTGEYYAQDLGERREVASLVKDAVGDRLPLVVGTVATRLADSIAMAEHAARIGASALLVGSPPYAMPTERENALNALAIDRAAGLPVMLYNYPGRTGVGMGAEFLDRVGRSRNVRAIKESSGDIGRVHLLARDYPRIRLSCGMDDQALEFFAWGARSWVCAGSNFLPGEHAALWRACAVEGDFDRGRRIMSAMMPLMRLLERGGKFIQCVKHGCEMAGNRAGPPWPPLRPLGEDDKRELERVVRALRRAVAEIEAAPRAGAAG